MLGNRQYNVGFISYKLEGEGREDRWYSLSTPWLCKTNWRQDKAEKYYLFHMYFYIEETGILVVVLRVWVVASWHFWTHTVYIFRFMSLWIHSLPRRSCKYSEICAQFFLVYLYLFTLYLGWLCAHRHESSTRSKKYQVSHKYICFSLVWAHSHPKQVEKGINILRKIVHKFRFIYKIIQGSVFHGHQILKPGKSKFIYLKWQRAIVQHHGATT